MEPELIYKPKIAIVGAGPAGCMCAIQLGSSFDVTIFDINKPLKTLLCTGGGRCNFAHSEFDFKELAHAYPRGEKFLYSIFSRFSTSDTLDFFKKIGVNYYNQGDGRIFPISNSAVDVREKMLAQIKHAKFKQEKVIEILHQNDKFLLKTKNNKYDFNIVVVAIGTHFGTGVLKNLPHKILELRPSLCGLLTKDDFSTLKGVVLNGVTLSYKKVVLKDSIIFTENGISGPLIFKISSINSREEFPYSVKIKFIENEEMLQSLMETSPNRELKTVMSSFFPKSFVVFLLNRVKISQKIRCSQLTTNTKELLLSALRSFEVEFCEARKGGETVFSGGICLDEISSNLESKLIKNLYFCGEIIDVDGFCGGYNLQNCWSTGALAASNILKTM